MYKRPVLKEILSRFSEPRQFIQVLSGPRQAGKTTLAMQIMDTLQWVGNYASADEPVLKGAVWIEQQWEIVRGKIHSGKEADRGILVLDEIQKLPQWSETVKRLWDEDTAASRNIFVLILGSSPLLIQKGLTESLAGRFEINHITHWSFKEMRAAFDLTIDEYIYYGGYPGAAGLLHDRQRWANYITESLIETTISKDILLMTRVDKPALLRNLFELGCFFSGRIISYQKMVGQLQDAGNTTTLAHYLNLLEGAGLLAGLSKYAGNQARRRASSPKLLVLNTGLMTAASALDMPAARKDAEFWGHLAESAVGAFLYNATVGKNIDLYYWAGRNRELDFALARGGALVAIEVKSSARRMRLPGIIEFSNQFPVKRKLLVGRQGIPVEEFMGADVDTWFE